MATDGWDGVGGRSTRRDIRIHRVDSFLFVWQKLAQHCKSDYTHSIMQRTRSTQLAGVLLKTVWFSGAGMVPETLYFSQADAASLDHTTGCEALGSPGCRLCMVELTARLCCLMRGSGQGFPSSAIKNLCLTLSAGSSVLISITLRTATTLPPPRQPSSVSVLSVSQDDIPTVLVPVIAGLHWDPPHSQVLNLLVL